MIRFLMITCLGSFVWALSLPTPPVLAQEVDLFVSSRGTNSVKRYDGITGEYLGDFVAPNSGGLSTTQEVVIGPDGRFYVSGRGTANILVFDPQSGESLGAFTEGYQLDNSTKMRFGPDGNLYVSQWGTSQSTIARFDGTTGAFMDEFIPENLNQPMDHAWDADGNYYVASFGSRDVRRYTADGTFIDVFIGSGLQGPVNLWFDEHGDLLVADWTTGMIRRYDGQTGAFKSNFITGMSRTEGVTLGPDGALYVGDWQANVINRYDASTGAFLGVFAQGGSLANPNSLIFAPRPRALPQVFRNEFASTFFLDGANSPGTSWVDYDSDGDLDIFVSNQGPNFLYQNNDATFTRITAGSLVTDNLISFGNCWADIDNDDDLDVMVVGNASALYVNEGQGTFSKPQLSVAFDGVTDLRGWSCAWADYDLDGFVDLAVTHAAGFHGGVAVPNFLFRNAGDGTFDRITNTDITNSGNAPYTVGTWSDYDLDGDPDYFIGSGPASTSPGPDFAFHNTFSETGQAGFSRITDTPMTDQRRDGQVWYWIDYDNDDDLDVHITNWGGNLGGGMRDELYRNDDGTFTRITTGPLVAENGVSLGAAWADFDNDGDLDVFIANGSGSQDNRYYENNGDGTFSRVRRGVLINARNTSWGAAAGDYDDDGDLDLFISNAANGSINFLYRNDSPEFNHWLKVKLTGTTSNRAGIGAMVRARATINASPVWQMREVSSQNTFNGHHAFDVHFGFGDAATIDTLLIRWPSGIEDRLTNVSTDQTLAVTEGSFPVSNGHENTLPSNLSLHTNYPNPFNPVTTIRYEVHETAAVRLAVYNVWGQEVATLVDGVQTPGVYIHPFDATLLPSGTYFYRLEALGQHITQAMTVLK